VTRPRNILVVEDESSLRELIAHILLLDEHEVDTARDGVEALYRIEQREYDLIISDLQMPNLDGPGLHEALRERYGQVVSGSPNVRHQETLLSRQQEARVARLGIWRTAGPTPPPARSGPPAPEARAAQGRPGQPPTNGWTCPLDHPIKGDFRTYSSERCIYYRPGTPTYVESRTDRCYATEDEARQDGCRRSRR